MLSSKGVLEDVEKKRNWEASMIVMRLVIIKDNCNFQCSKTNGSSISMVLLFL